MKQKFLTKLVSAAVILTASGNSFVPMAVLAADFDEEHYLQTHGWLYSVKADKAGSYQESESDQKQTVANSTDIRGLSQIVSFDLTDSETLTLNFEKIEQRNSQSSAALTANQENEIHLTWTDPKNFKVEVVGSDGNVISSNKSYGELELKNDAAKTAKVRITPKNENVGTYSDYVLFMDQNSRVGWPVFINHKVNKKSLSVTLSGASIEKKYGQKLTPADIACSVTENPSIRTLADLGVKNLADVVSNPENLNFSSLKVGYADLAFKTQAETDNYSLTIAGTAKLNVNKQDLKLTNLGVSGSGESLSNYKIVGQCVDAATGTAVKGSFAWENASQTVAAGQKYRFTFTPDTANIENYNSYSGETSVDLEFKSNSFGKEAEPTYVTIDPTFLSKTYTGGDLSFKAGEYTTNYPETVNFRYKVAGTNGYEDKFVPKEVGTYDVKIWVGGTEVNGKLYSSLSAQTKLVITPAELGTDKKITFNIASKPYNGETKAQILSIGNVDPNTYIAKKDGTKVTTTDEFEKYFEANFSDSEVGENKTVTITLTDKGKEELSLQGKNAANYKLPESFESTGTIYEATTNLQVKDNVKKHFGQTMNFVSADFASASNLAEGDVLDDLKLVASSAGENSSAQAGSYPITAISSNKNYIVGKITGTLTVEKTTPVAVGEVTTSTGKASQKAQTIENSLQGVFTNPYNNEIVPGTIKLSSGEGSKELTQSTTLQYTFYPKDTADYETTTGTLTVESERNAISLAVSGSQTFTYDGEEKSLTFKAEDTAHIDAKYQNLAGDPVTPVDVGIYKVTATANPENTSKYVSSTLNTELVIEPASVTVVFNKPDEDVTGKKLSEVEKSYTATNSKGEKVEGIFSWNSVDGVKGEEETIVAGGASYQWTFQPASSNYKTAAGSVQLADAPVPIPHEETEIIPEQEETQKPADEIVDSQQEGSEAGDEKVDNPEGKADSPEEKIDDGKEQDPAETPANPKTPADPSTQETPVNPSTQIESPSETSSSTTISGSEQENPGSAEESADAGNKKDSPSKIEIETGTENKSKTETDTGKETAGGSDTEEKPGSESKDTPKESESADLVEKPEEDQAKPEKEQEKSEEEQKTPETAKPEDKPAASQGNAAESLKSNGTIEKVVKAEDGTTTTTTLDIEGTKATFVESSNGFAGGTISLSYTSMAKGKVDIDMPAVPAGSRTNSAPIEIKVPEQGKEVLVSIPVENGNDGSVAVAILNDGSEAVLSKSIYKEGKIIVPVAANSKIVIRDNAKVFKDVTGQVDDYPANGIAFLSARGIMKGTGDGSSFSPKSTVTRGQLATLLYRYEGSPAILTRSLPAGVSPTDYFADGAAWASQVGLMAVGSSFNGGQELTREQLAMILYRLEGMEGQSIEVNENLINAYSDADEISSPEMRKAVAWAVGNGIMGKGTAHLNPSGTSIRQDLAAMIARYIQNK